MIVYLREGEINVTMHLEHKDEQLFRPSESMTIADFLTTIGVKLDEKIYANCVRYEWIAPNVANAKYTIEKHRN